MKNITLRQLVVFKTVARHLHFTRAAEALGTSQPSVFMQIKQIEDNLGVALFEQIGKRIYLTEAGRELQRYGKEINRQLAEAETALDRRKGSVEVCCGWPSPRRPSISCRGCSRNLCGDIQA